MKQIKQFYTKISKNFSTQYQPNLKYNMDKSKLDADTLAEMEFWDAYSEDYAKYFEIPNLESASTVARMLQVSKAKSVLEIGCGPGRLTEHILPQLSSGSKYFALDISQNMIKLAKERVSKLNLSNDIEVNQFIGNAEDLSQIPNESLDIVIAPLIIHTVPRPDKVLSEIKRVLKPNGKFGCNVLGEKELNTQFRFRDAFAELGHIEESSETEVGFFYLGKKANLIDLVSKNGFEVGFCWEQDALVEIFNDEDVIHQLRNNFEYKDLMEKLNKEQQDIAIKKVLEIFHGFQEKKQPLVIRSTSLISTKDVQL